MKRTDDRYPHTYAYDMLRSIHDNGAGLSRSDASRLMYDIAELGLDIDKLRKVFADAYLLENASVAEVLSGRE